MLELKVTLYCIVKHVHVVISIKQSPVIKGNISLSCHRTFHMKGTSIKKSPVKKGHIFICSKCDLLIQVRLYYTKLIFVFSVILICIAVVVIMFHSGDGSE